MLYMYMYVYTCLTSRIACSRSISRAEVLSRDRATNRSTLKRSINARTSREVRRYRSTLRAPALTSFTALTSASLTLGGGRGEGGGGRGEGGGMFNNYVKFEFPGVRTFR